VAELARSHGGASEAVADRVLAAVRANRRCVVVGWQARWLWPLKRLAPVATTAALRLVYGRLGEPIPEGDKLEKLSHDGYFLRLAGPLPPWRRVFQLAGPLLSHGRRATALPIQAHWLPCFWPIGLVEQLQPSADLVIVFTRQTAHDQLPVEARGPFLDKVGILSARKPPRGIGGNRASDK